MACSPNDQITIFISFAPHDERVMQELVKQMRPLEQQGLIEIWHNQSIRAGANWEQERDLYLNSAKVILMLISPDFMNADYCYGVEMPRAMQRHLQDNARVVPIILRPVYWQGAPFGQLQALPKDGIPITNEKWHDLDEAIYSVVEGLREILDVKSQFASNPELLKPSPLHKDHPAIRHRVSMSLAFFLKRWWLLSILIGTAVVTGMTLLQPAWCPGSLCSSSQAPPGGTSDENLHAYFLTQQSTSFQLQGALKQYTLQNLPKTVAAVRSDNVQSSAYRLVIAMQNLHQTGYEIYIETVALVIHAVPPLANPLNVWNTSTLSYNTAPYYLTYAGEPAGRVLEATFEPVPQLTNVHQRLQPQERDNIDLQINPIDNLQADLQFQVRITYSMANEDQRHILTLPDLFEVVFSNANNWHAYQF